jgi:hypothetical protein
MTTITDRLEAEIADLRNLVAALTHDAAVAREQARDVVRPLDPYAESAARVKAEKQQHEAWKQSRGYGAATGPQVTLEDAGDEYERRVASALQAERDQKAAWQQRARDNAARRAAAGVVEPDAMARAASGAARQREIEIARRTRVAPIVEEALAPVGDLR